MNQKFGIGLPAALLTILGTTLFSDAKLCQASYLGAEASPLAEVSVQTQQAPSVSSTNLHQLGLTTNLAAVSSSCVGAASCGKEMTALRSQVKEVMARYKSLSSGMFFLDMDTGNYLDINGDRIFPAASTIKLPILVAFFQDLDAGKVSLNETLVMRRSLITNGSGTMQYKKAGTKFTALETVTKMVTISDNTATNMIIDRLGGIAKLNQRFRSWGLKDTVIHHLLADLKGTNTTSSQDMVKLLALLAQEKLVSEPSRQQLLGILRRTTTKTLLPAGLGSGAVIANKTGDIGFLVGDAGIIDMPNGKRYLAAIFVRRPYKDPKVRSFVSQISRLVYNYLEEQTDL
ncbi:MAG: class A beta-lactamase-related serine hydrolase [Aphanothece sp. CMT-3BRIN-NPC111]|jgi:beta-lactamase class A|nr:class A beta-lactamase-related serine hydrolase [Aphanothece sp. CMT-3BRIN-NPC111]